MTRHISVGYLCLACIHSLPPIKSGGVPCCLGYRFKCFKDFFPPPVCTVLLVVVTRPSLVISHPRCVTTKQYGRRETAGVLHMMSAMSGPSSGWVTALPGAPSTRLHDGDFVLAGRHFVLAGRLQLPIILVTAVSQTLNT